MRDCIEDIIETCVFYDGRPELLGTEQAADAIIAALPDMIAPLVWDGHDLLQTSKCGTYCIQDFLGKVIIKGTLSVKFDSMEAAKAAANAHHRAAIMEAFK